MVHNGIRGFFATIVTLTKAQRQETNAHYRLKYYK